MSSNKRPVTAPRKPSDTRTVTSEDIVAHLDAFAAAGGKVEVLGTTRVLKNIDGAAATATKPLPRR